MKILKITALVLSLIMILSLISCGKKKSEDADAAAPDTETLVTDTETISDTETALVTDTKTASDTGKTPETETVTEKPSSPETEKTAELMDNVSKLYEELISFSDLYDSASFEAKKMIVNQLIRRVDVYRGYQLNITFNFDLTPYIEGDDAAAC